MIETPSPWTLMKKFLREQSGPDERANVEKFIAFIEAKGEPVEPNEPALQYAASMVATAVLLVAVATALDDQMQRGLIMASRVADEFVIRELSAVVQREVSGINMELDAMTRTSRKESIH
jgi:hypothetical protein